MKILFIGARLFDDVYFYLQERNIYGVLTESNENSDNIDLADKYYIVPRGMDEPMRIAIEEEVDGVIPLIGVDPPLLDLASMKEILESDHNIPVISSNKTAVKICINKFLTKEFFKYFNIKTPNYFVFQNNNLKNHLNGHGSLKFKDIDLSLDNDLRSFIEYFNGHEHEVHDKNSFRSDFGFHHVLKQFEGQGGKNIAVVNDNKSFFDYTNRFALTLCEEYVNGYEISIEVLSYNDEHVPLVPVYKGETDLKGTHPLNKVRYAPSEIDGLDNDLIKDLAVKIAKNLNAEGTIDIDFIFSKKDKEIYAIEINPRPSGTRYLSTASTSVSPLLKLVDMVSGNFNVKEIDREIKDYHALEVPIGSYTPPEHGKPFKKFNKNSWIVHGPENYKRITISGENREKLYEITNDVLKLGDFING
ncbi:MAG: ATP-grasp domain-containing protein [Methanobrevibacter sp.]|jgi:carbamoylphosphate synthase large subunit|nr:ATP-grasp domain-containing protein [Candidatus Methanovirga aequatorialis]